MLLLAAGFLMPTGAAWSDVFYVISGPAILVALWRGGVRENWLDPTRALPIGLILWSAATVFWCTDPARRNFLYLVQGLCCLVYFAGLVTALDHARFARAMGTVLILFGTLNAAISEVLYPWRNGIGGRLGGLGETRQAILGASVIAVAALFALFRALNGDGRRWWCLAAAIVMAGFVALTQSRGPLAGLSAGILVLILASRWRWRILPPLIGLPALALMFDRSLRDRLIGVFSERGNSFRFEIWQASLRRIGEHPWIGHGMGAKLAYKEFTFPHDVYLSLLFYSGAVGLVLFGAIVWRLLGGVIRRPGAERMLLISLWANMLVSGLTDYGQIIKGPSPLWYIIWLPMAYSATYVVGNAAGQRG